MIVYLFSQYDVLRPLTNAVADMRLCEGLSSSNSKVHLIVPEVIRSDNIHIDSIPSVFDIERQFNIKLLKTNCKDNTAGRRKAFKIAFLCLQEFLRISRSMQNSFLISRNMYILFPMILSKKIFGLKNAKIINWTHEISKGFIHAYVYRNTDFTIATNSAIKEDLVKMFNLDERKFALSLNPVSPKQAAENLTKDYARKEIGYTETKPLIVYTGKLYIGQKEVKYILDAASELVDYNFLFTGGKPNVIEHYRDYCNSNNLNNCIFTGYIHNYSKIKFYQYAADVLINYYSRDEHLVDYNLPSKICEYMLTGNAIITPGFRALKDLLNERNAYFVEAENSAALTAGIKQLINDKELRERLGKRARNDVMKVTSDIIGKNIIDSLKSTFNC